MDFEIRITVVSFPPFHIFYEQKNLSTEKNGENSFSYGRSARRKKLGEATAAAVSWVCVPSPPFLEIQKKAGVCFSLWE